jgi:error-prone DNA polymerase
MQRLFAHCPEAVSNSVHLANSLTFTLADLGYAFPEYAVPPGETMESFLRTVTLAGARARYSHLSRKVRHQLEHELDLICRLGFAGYFLIVWDIVNFCSANNILVQGRGSAANSAVCYSLGITACDPIAGELLFERFLSEGRTSWPDIDLDLPSGPRREAVIQELYRRHAPEGAAMTANVITFRGRSAMREIGKALNFPPAVLGRFSALFASGDFPHTLALHEQLENAGVPASHPRAPAAVRLYTALRNLPRHLGQHSGGMILCRGRLSEIVPLENASMEGRVVAQWDKYDCEELGIIKVDLLGLGMMAVMQDCIELCSDRNRPVDLAAIPKDDPATYRLMQEADTIGVFQIESRAQMATLPRMKPRCFYDVVVEVAIIRPGPIQGDMVHPYLARRSGKEPVTYLHPDLEPVLKRTLGVALFQEQLLRIAMVIAGFSAAEAEELRRALSDLRSRERMERVCERLRLRMRERHHSDELIDHVIQSMRSFALYGFPESHAISFALIAYASAWMKVHRAPEFYAALLNNQPMGFYSSATLVRDARAHQVRMLPPSVLHSEEKCTVIDDTTVRLGLSLISGLPTGQTQLLLSERARNPFTSLADFRQRVPLNRDELRLLARAGAFQGLTEHRRDALWRIQEPLENDLFHPKTALLQTNPTGASHCLDSHQQPLVAITPSPSCDPPNSAYLPVPESGCPLRPMTPPERMSSDYAATGVTVGRHPMEFLRENLPEAWNARQIRAAANKTALQTAGMVICRQRPGTAKGFVFLSLEDETGISNIIVPPTLYEQTRLLIASESFLQIDGLVQQHEGVTHVRALRIRPLPTTLPSARSHDFH